MNNFSIKPFIKRSEPPNELNKVVVKNTGSGLAREVHNYVSKPGLSAQEEEKYDAGVRNSESIEQ